MKYDVYRYYFDNRRPELQKEGLTLEEVEEWCNREDTHGDGWFDGFVTAI